MREGAPERCFIVQDIALKESGQRLLQVAVGYPDEGTRPIAIVTVPLGILLPAGVGLAVDDAEGVRFPVQYCIALGCRSQIALDERLEGQF